MASLRPGSKNAGRSGDGSSRRMATYMETSAEPLPPTLTQRARREADSFRTTASTSTRPGVSSRIPQNLSGQKPSATTLSSRPPATHQSRSWGSAQSNGSPRSGAAVSASSIISPGKSQNVNPTQSRNMLRRRPDNLSQDSSSLRNNSRNDSRRTSSSSSVPRSQTSLDSSSGFHFDRGLTESPTEIRVAKQAEVTSAHSVTIYPELDRYRDVRPHLALATSSIEVPHRIATHDLPPPTPQFSGTSSLISGVSGSPSTRFSESPGPGPYSRDTTPTSISSQSPGLIAPMRIPATRSRQGSRGRAGSFSNDAPNEKGGVSADIHSHTLAAIRESLTSSSSSSNGTVRDVGQKEKKKKKRLSPLPPSPPPRKSSQKFHQARDEEDSPSKPSREPAQPVMTIASPAKATSSTQSPVVTSSPRSTPPVRPSRDGTPDLQTQLGLPMPVIHSNLSSTSLSERRASTTLGPSPLNRSVTPSSQPDRPNPPSRLPVGREPTPAPRADVRQAPGQEPGRSTRTPSPSVSTFRTRFPLFGRRSKTTSDVPQVDKKEKPARKGPAAGTGHEGYGRLGGHRRRSSSNSARGLSGTMSSQESLSNLPSDPFLMDRMNPVVIAGGEIIENRNTSSELSRTDSNQSFDFRRPSIESRNDSQVSLSSREGGRHTLWPSAFPRSTSQAPSLGSRSRRPSDSSDSEALAMKSTLAFRRSVQRLRGPDQPQVRMPKPIVVRPAQGATTPSMNSLDTSIMSDDSAMDPRPATSRGRKETAPTNPKKLTKRARSPRKWNFFSRSQSQPAEEKTKTRSSTKVPATVKVVPAKPEAKPVAFYTMMDSSEQEDGDIPDVKEVLREAQILDAPSPRFLREAGRRPSVDRTVGRRDSYQNLQTSPQFRQPPQALSPAVPPARTPEPALQLQVNREELSPRPGGRPSRLPQVGRIPKVISARPEQTSPKSFSRPFNRVSMQMLPPRVEMQDSDSVAKGPSPPKPSTPELTQGSTLTATTGDSRDRLSREFSPDIDRVANEFLSFSPLRKGSQSTSCTTSSSSGILTFADATAVVRDVCAPLVEDEIWDEYNDLLGEDAIKIPPSAGSSQGAPFHLEVYGRRKSIKQAEHSMESPTLNHHSAKRTDEDIVDEKPPVPSSVYSADFTAKINEVLAAAQNPFSATDFVSAYGQRNETPQRNSNSSNSSGRKARRSTASTCSQVSEDNSPLSQVNLRVGSMTVSKWLTFGHVLFSPAREELMPVVGSLKRHSILVIDGLGNDDWSFYAAETYPAATFFNLSPRAPLPTEQRSPSAFPLSPPNHHQIQYTSHMDKFPFAPESFTTVVFRFPTAAPESQYRNIIAEARRVLKPGGYLELSILDLDLNNVGNRGRRAVRRLKERINVRSPDTNIGSTADVMVRLLGTKGFSDIKSCRVGVPVASTITRSSGSETSGSRRSKDPKAKKDTRSLAEMMSDQGPVADESITKMVAKVGRWWYNRCYENAAATVGPANSTIWNDAALLAECEEWRTSLKLMVCYARVPDVKRVASI